MRSKRGVKKGVKKWSKMGGQKRYKKSVFFVSFLGVGFWDKKGVLFGVLKKRRARNFYMPLSLILVFKVTLFKKFVKKSFSLPPLKQRS